MAPSARQITGQEPSRVRNSFYLRLLPCSNCPPEAPVSGQFSSITAQWQVPGIYSPGPPLTSDTYWLYEWVGIDSSCGVILQSGTGQTVSFLLFSLRFQNLTVEKLNADGWTNLVWWEWFPGPPVSVNMPINYQDWFQVTITASSTESGTITIENMTQNYSFSVDVSDGQTLCLQNAEWVVENPVSGSMPCPNFDEVWFAQCSATTTTGATMGIDGTTAIHMASSDGTTIYSEYVDNTDVYVAW